MFKSILFVTLLLLLVHSSSSSYFNVTADNTFAFWFNGVQKISLCPDSETVEAGSPISNCAWTNTSTFDLGDSVTAGSLLALQGHDALGTNTNPLTGGTNPGAVIYTLTITGVGICDPLLYWTCIDDLQSTTLYGSSAPPSAWATEVNFDTSSWTTGPLDDLGINAAQAWAGFPAPAPTLYNGDSIWFNDQGASKGISSDGHWQWYRHTQANTNIYCRLVIPANGGCPASTDNPPPLVSACALTA